MVNRVFLIGKVGGGVVKKSDRVVQFNKELDGFITYLKGVETNFV